MTIAPSASAPACTAAFFHGMAGRASSVAPHLHFSLAIDPLTRALNGLAEIDWVSVAPPYDKLKVPQIRGLIHWNGTGRFTTVFGFEGTFAVERAGTNGRASTGQLTASFAIDNSGRGIGVFKFGPTLPAKCR